MPRLIHIPMPEEPLEPFERPYQDVAEGVHLLAITGRLRETLGRLLQNGPAHGDVKPVKDVLGLWMEGQLYNLEVPDSLSIIRKEGKMTV